MQASRHPVRRGAINYDFYQRSSIAAPQLHFALVRQVLAGASPEIGRRLRAAQPLQPALDGFQYVPRP